MKKGCCFCNFLLGMFIFCTNNVSTEQARTFILEQNGARLQFRVSLSKDSFYLLEPITFDIAVKNISKRPFLGSAIGSPWWTIEHESGTTYKYRDPSIVLDSEKLAPGDSVNKSTILERINTDPMTFHQYFTLGKYKAFYGPDTIPFSFRIIINLNSKNHLRRAKFVQFCETYPSGKYFFDTTLGVPWQLGLPGNNLSKGRTRNDLVKSAYEFFKINKEMFGITLPLSELKVSTSRKNKDGAIVSFVQHYKGIIVFNSGLNISLDSSGRARFVGGTFYPDIDVPIWPRVGDSAAISIVRGDVGPQDKDAATEKPLLGIFYNKSKYYLAWLIKTSSLRYFIDAKNGTIIDKAYLPRYE